MTSASAPTNPFFNRQRITDARYFVGRALEIEALCSAVATRQCRAVVGERKLGKSSLLTHLARPDTLRAHNLDPGKHIFLYVDLEGMQNITYEEFWPEILDRLEVVLPETQTDLRQMTRELALSVEVRFTQVRRLLRRIDREGLVLVLMLDEFESLASNPAFSASFYGELRSLAGELGVVYITASKRSLYDLTYTHADTLSSPFFNIFSEVRLGLMPPDEATHVLTTLSAQADVPAFDATQTAALIELAGPQPFFLQVAGSYLYLELKDGQVDAEALERMGRRFRAEAEDHFRYLWAQLEPDEQHGLMHLDRATDDLLKRLLAKALVRKPDGGRLKPFGAAFAEFVARAEPLERPQRSVTSDLTGTTLGNYRVLSEVGRGGMAVVYKGYQPSLDRYVAVKVMSPSLAKEDTFLERFQREAASVARLRHHNIVQVFDYGVQSDISYMVMEFVDGDTLKARLGRLDQSGERLQPNDVVQLTRGIAAALDYAHAHGIVHRDVKPANVLLRTEEKLAELTGAAPFEAVLTDFGVARMYQGQQLTNTGATIGTPDYMSPEQARGETAGAASDIYALGIVVFEMLTGELPFNADTPLAMLLKHMNAVPPSILEKRPEIGPDVEWVLHKALAKYPEDRYQTAGELATELALAFGKRTV